MEGAPDPGAAGQPGPPPFVSPFRARRLNPLLPAASRLFVLPVGPRQPPGRPMPPVGPPRFWGREPATGFRSLLPSSPTPPQTLPPRAPVKSTCSAAGSFKLFHCPCRVRGPNSLPLRGCGKMGIPLGRGCQGSGKGALRGPWDGASGEAVRAPGLSLCLLPLQPQSGVRQAGEREDRDAAPLCDGERRRAGGREATRRGPGRLKRVPTAAIQGRLRLRCDPRVPSDPHQPS